MDAQTSETVAIPAVEEVKPAVTSCRRKKSDDATFLQDVKDHIDEFIHSSTEEHKTCFTKTIHKMFGMSKAVAKREAEAKHIESALPLRTTVADQFAAYLLRLGNGRSNSKANQSVSVEKDSINSASFISVNLSIEASDSSPW